MNNACLANQLNKHRSVVLLIMIAAAVLTASAVSVTSLYDRFNVSRGNRQVIAANELMQALKAENYVDTLYQFSNSEATRMNSLVHYHMSEYFYLTSQYALALDAGKRACDASQHYHDQFYSSDLNNLLGITHVRLGNYVDALSFFEKAYNIDLELNDEERLSSDMNSQASVYLSAKLPEQGIACIKKAIDIERRLKHDHCLAVRLGMASELYLSANQPHTALIYANEAYQLDKKGGRIVKSAVRQSQIAAALMAMDSIASARENLVGAIAVLREAGEKNSLSICYNQMGELSLKTGNLGDAENYFNSVLDLCSQTGNRNLERKAEQGLWQALRESNPVQALVHLERYNALGDSLLASETMSHLNSCRIKFKVDELQRENRHNSRWMKVLAWTCAVLALLLLGLLQLLLHYRKKSRMQEPLVRDSVNESLRSPVNADVIEPTGNEQLVPVVDAIYANMASGRCDEASIAGHMDISVRKLRDIISQNAGEKPAAFILNVRLANAKRLLKHSDLSVSEISQRCGFHSIAHFSKAFKMMCNVSPTQYRRLSTIEQNEDNQNIN